MADPHLRWCCELVWRRLVGSWKLGRTPESEVVSPSPDEIDDIDETKPTPPVEESEPPSERLDNEDPEKGIEKGQTGDRQQKVLASGPPTIQVRPGVQPAAVEYEPLQDQVLETYGIAISAIDPVGYVSSDTLKAAIKVRTSVVGGIAPGSKVVIVKKESKTDA